MIAAPPAAPAPPGRRAPPWLTLTCFGVAFVALFSGAGLLVLRADAVLRHYQLPAGLALAHVAILGWIAFAIMGALAQLAPVVVQRPLASVRAAATGLLLFGLGTVLLSVALGTTTVALLPVAGTLTGIGGGIVVLTLAATLWRVEEWTAPALFVATGLTFLALGGLIGVTFSFTLRFGWFPVLGSFLAVHALLGIVGWFGLTLLGVAYRLVPMFLLVPATDERWAQRILVLLAASLSVLTVTLLAGIDGPVRLLAVAGLFAGFLLWVVDMSRLYRRRFRRAVDLYTVHLLVMLTATVLVACAGALTLGGVTARVVGEPRAMLALGLLVILGWLTPAIMGHCYKIVPMLVWQWRQQALPGRPGQLLTTMYNHRLGEVALAAYVLGVGGLIAATLAGRPDALRAAAAITAVAVAGFIFNMARVALLIPRPGRGRTAVAKEATR